MLRKNTAGQHIGLGMVVASTGAALTGATVTASRVIDGGAQATATGTVTEKGLGQYDFAPSQADVNGNQISFFFTASTAVPVEKTIVTTAADPTDAVRFGLTALPNVVSGSAGAVLTSGTGTAQISTTGGQVLVQSGAGTGQLDVTAGVAKSNLVQINGSTNISSDGTATAGGANTITLDSGVTFETNTLADRVITIDGGTGAGQSELILSNTNATPSIVTIARNWPVVAPDNTSTYTITESNSSVLRPGNVTGNIPADLQTIKTEAVTCSAGVTFPASLASPTNITAGVITTVTNLTNAASIGDFTSTMKTSLNAATPASVVGAVGSVTGLTASDVGAIKTKTDFLPSSTAGSAGGLFIAGTNAATTVTTAFTSTFAGNLTGSVGSVTSPVTLNQTTIVATPRDLSSVADGALTIGDALVCAIAEAAGRETIVGTTYTKKSPFTATPIRVFTLDSSSAPTSRS